MRKATTCHSAGWRSIYNQLELKFPHKVIEWKSRKLYVIGRGKDWDKEGFCGKNCLLISLEFETSSKILLVYFLIIVWSNIKGFFWIAWNSLTSFIWISYPAEAAIQIKIFRIERLLRPNDTNGWVLRHAAPQFLWDSHQSILLTFPSSLSL